MADTTTTTAPDKQTQLQRLVAAGVIPLQPQAPGQSKLQPVGPQALQSANSAQPKLTPLTAPTIQPVGQPISPGGLQKVNLPGDPADRAPLNFQERQALPVVSPGAPAGSLASNEAQLGRLKDQDANPWGSAGNHPGTLGHVGHWLGRIANAAGDIIDPRAMRLIPGTELNKQGQEAGLQREVDVQGKEQATEEATKAAQGLAGQKEADEEKLHEAQEKNFGTKDEEALLKQGLKRDTDGNIVTDPDSLAYKRQQQNEQTSTNLMALRTAQTDLSDARAELARSQNDPNSPAYKLALEKVAMAEQAHQVAMGNLGLKRDEYNANYLGTGPQGTALPGVQTTPEGQPIGTKVAGQNRAALSEFNKAYVQPAEGVEKSYQMMDQAYKEFEAARAQGKELPTGAQSMLALSTHLATTFGNVKGSRVTRDMIQEHLGARSVPDSALVAVQKLTNGDVLSPAQWTAFHDLIGASRKLSWDTATKEAKRANLPVDFLPADLQPKGGAGGGAAKPGAGNDPLGIR